MMSKATILALLALLAAPTVLANLGQEIAQTSEVEVGDTVDIVADDPITLPTIDEIPGDTGADLNATGVAPPTPPLPQAPAAGDTNFADSRLGAALSAQRPGVTPEDVSVQFIIGFWHQVALDLQLADYSRTDETGTEIDAPENPGPCYSARAFAIAHLAMYDAYVGVTGEGATYLEYPIEELPSANGNISEGIRKTAGAISAGITASLVLRELYQNPEDRQRIDVSLNSFISSLFELFPPFLDLSTEFLSEGAWPVVVTAAHIGSRQNDGSDAGPPFVVFDETAPGATDPFQHVPDPIAIDPESGNEQFIYAPHWGDVTPFAPILPDPPLPEPLSNNYPEDFQEVLTIGERDADVGPNSTRTQDQTIIGLFWAYDGGFRIGVPPRLYNQIVDDIIIREVIDNSPQLATGFQLVRLYAMVNMALADAGTAAWRDKYRFNFWRPIIGIRRANETAEVAALQDPDWVPLGAPNTNRNRPGINPAFPAYPSGHATFGTAALEVTRAVLQIPSDKVFTMNSDEFNGMAVDDGYCAKFECVFDRDNLIDPDEQNKRPNLPRSLTIDDAIEENKRSRIFLGVHWQFDQDFGDILGQAVAEGIVNGFPFRG